MSGQILHGLYVITSHQDKSERLIPDVAAAIQGGARIVQYRDKGEDRERRLWEIQDLVNLCRPLGVPLLVNDDVELARDAGADGVHIGQGDMNLVEARRLLGDQAIIGVTCHNDLELALRAEADGTGYVAFGSFFPSPTKPQAVRAEPALLREAKERLSVPVVAIGGINADNGASLIEAGADMLAVIDAVFSQPDITAAARRLSTLFD